MQDDLFESVWVEIVNRNSKIALLMLLCLSTSNTDPTGFNEHFEHIILSNISTEKKQIFILGDFNFDLLKYHSGSETQDVLHSFMSNGLLPTIHQPTRVTTRTATIIDNIYTTVCLLEFGRVSSQ